ncbi:Alpha/Beta hydrolase protein [Ilyonectria robusta]|uniref:Alpha/Beta hydrolase protein n=1 Tax=Ilyonectria robusta TaxID=1079257 RepID=UPI001E8D44B2|nr:Alpha/Beta hydrolase protein [Ilyonectria robusta]KAH8652920.1 Alpha/Beta hydrolase protein [Ilyonectria robusta]
MEEQETGASPAPAVKASPLVRLPNGTLAGTYNRPYRQDFFLGFPYAAPPVGDLRFRRPAPPKAWHGITRQADSYSSWCLGNSLHLRGFSQNVTGESSENCLYMNLVRPSSAVHVGHGSKPAPLLPVLVWLHGGGWSEGSANDGRYNGSFLVHTSVKMGTPIIYASFNYRPGLFGRMSGPIPQEAGVTNLLLHDQRQALAWIQENIVYFGGDKARVTIMGESAGAGNVGHHLLAPDEGLFSAAIAHSSGPFASNPFLDDAAEAAAFTAALNVTGCTDALQPLDCLRSVPAEVIQKAGTSVPQVFVQDGEILTDRSSRLLAAGQFVKVPLLIGSNRNDGTTLTQLDIEKNSPVNTLQEFADIITSVNAGNVPPLDALCTWWRLYQEEIDNPSVAGLGTVVADGGKALGSAYGKMSLWEGDNYFTAGRRYANQVWAEHRVPSYSFLFDTVTASLSPQRDGAAHFQEILYAFGNKDAVGWEQNPFPTDPELRAKHFALADAMSRMWVSFVATGSPNNHKVPGLDITWPEYSKGNPTNMVFSATEGVHVQPDTWRAEALQSFIDLADEFNR